ncbi:MAG: AraC family transcriptional regulator, partial [Bacteroidota bacterium]
MIDIFHIKTISEVHEQYGLPKPSHPMVSVITDFSGAQHIDLRKIKVTTELYSISLKSKSDGAFRYGRKTYDFQEGTLIFLKPNQVAGYDDGDEPITPESTWNLLFHPDLIRKSELGRVINDYTFFDYDAREALHLSNEEKRSINEIIGFIKK